MGQQSLNKFFDVVHYSEKPIPAQIFELKWKIRKIDSLFSLRCEKFNSEKVNNLNQGAVEKNSRNKSRKIFSFGYLDKISWFFFHLELSFCFARNVIFIGILIQISFYIPKPQIRIHSTIFFYAPISQVYTVRVQCARNSFLTPRTM